MLKTKIKRQLKELSTRNAGEVLQVLRQIYDNNEELRNSVVMLSARYNQHRKSVLNGTIKSEDSTLEFNQIIERVLILIDAVSPEEAAAYELEHSIFQKILIVCQQAERRHFMKSLFSEQYYKEVRLWRVEDNMSLQEVNGFDLVIFDNHGDTAGEPSDSLLKFYLNEAQPYMLYFGHFLPLLQQYPDKVYFTNSVFSIHARVREMIEYLKYKESH